MTVDIRMNFGPYDALGKPYGVEGILSAMDKYGIEKAVLLSTLAINADLAQGNKELYEAIAENERLFGYLTVNPNYPEESIQLMRSTMNLNKFVALALFRGATKPYPNLLDYKEILNAYRRFCKPAFINTPSREAVEAAEEIASQFPGIKFIFGSMGGPHWRRSISEKKQLNVFLEISGSLDADKIDAAVESFGAHRVLFGSNAPFTDQASMLALIKSSGVSADAMAKIVSSNAEKLLGLGATTTSQEAG